MKGPLHFWFQSGILLSVFLCSLIALVLRIHSRRRRGGKGGLTAPPPTPSWQVKSSHSLLVGLILFYLGWWSGLFTFIVDWSQLFSRLQMSWNGRRLPHLSFHLSQLLLKINPSHHLLKLKHLLLTLSLHLTLVFLNTVAMERQH